MKSRLFCLCVLVMMALAVFSQTQAQDMDVITRYSNHPLPTPDANGDYMVPSNGKYWMVVDPDWDNGLNGRLTPEWPADWEHINVKWPQSNVATWPVVARFFPGTVLNASWGNRGAISLKDHNGKPWLMIQISRDRYCFVRANKRFIQPVRITR